MTEEWRKRRALSSCLVAEVFYTHARKAYIRLIGRGFYEASLNSARQRFSTNLEISGSKGRLDNALLRSCTFRAATFRPRTLNYGPFGFTSERVANEFATGEMQIYSLGNSCPALNGWNFMWRNFFFQIFVRGFLGFQSSFSFLCFSTGRFYEKF